MNDLEPKEKRRTDDEDDEHTEDDEDDERTERSVFVFVVLDASGSMSTRQSIVKEGMKEVDKTIASDAKTSYYQFSDRDSLREVTRGSKYEPNGMTALYDAILQILQILKKKGEIKDTMLVVITDGEDNDSRSSPRDVEKELLGKIHFFSIVLFFL